MGADPVFAGVLFCTTFEVVVSVCVVFGDAEVVVVELLLLTTVALPMLSPLLPPLLLPLLPPLLELVVFCSTVIVAGFEDDPFALLTVRLTVYVPWVRYV